MPEHLTRLRQLLSEHFDEEELRTLCFDMSLDYDDLPGGSKANKARELVAYLQRHDCIPELLEIGQRFRPDLDWSQTYLDDRLTNFRTRRDQTDLLRREQRSCQRVVNLRPLDMPRTFRDRASEMRELRSYLAQDGVRLISIVGRGGMGKTALASRVLADLEHGPLLVPDGKQELEVNGIIYLSALNNTLRLERIYADVGRMLGEPAASRLAARWTSGNVSLVAKIEYLLETMQDGLYLILLDNIEDLLAEDGTIADEGLRLFVEHCLVRPSGARLIATSRERIDLPPVALSGVRSILLRGGLPEFEAIALLRELDPQAEFGLWDAPEDDLRRAGQLTSGIPRALEIIASILSADPAMSLSLLLTDKNLFDMQVVETVR